MYECDGIDNDQDGHADEGFADTDGDLQADCVDGDDVFARMSYKDAAKLLD